MNIGGRVGFNRIEELESHFRGIDFPIELALPWQYTDLWLPIEDQLDEVIQFFSAKDIRILSIHATQGRLSDSEFLRWGKLTVELARELGVDDITVHPDNCKQIRTQYQELALQNLRRVEMETNCRGIFSMETFGGSKRIFRPREIMDFKLPMTLDTSHIHDRNEIMEIVNQYHEQIRTVHLSAIGQGEQHQPVDAFCVQVVERLKELHWPGNIILEYMPWYHYRVRRDILSLNDFVRDNIPVEIIPPDDRFRDKPEHWGYTGE